MTLFNAVSSSLTSKIMPLHYTGITTPFTSTDDINSLTELGRLYLEQKLPGEARNYLLRAAELSLQAKDFAGARSGYC